MKILKFWRHTSVKIHKGGYNGDKSKVTRKWYSRGSFGLVFWQKKILKTSIMEPPPVTWKTYSIGLNYSFSIVSIRLSTVASIQGKEHGDVRWKSKRNGRIVRRNAATAKRNSSKSRRCILAITSTMQRKNKKVKRKEERFLILLRKGENIKRRM